MRKTNSTNVYLKIFTTKGNSAKKSNKKKVLLIIKISLKSKT